MFIFFNIKLRLTDQYNGQAKTKLENNAALWDFHLQNLNYQGHKPSLQKFHFPMQLTTNLKPHLEYLGHV